MNIKPLHANFRMPVKATERSGAHDLFMPEDGMTFGAQSPKVSLGFAAEVPPGHAALLLPRSGVGANFGLELNNTCGVIDEDYRGEWMVALRTKDGEAYRWKAGDRLIQVLIVPVAQVTFNLVEELTTTERGTGGFGHSGQ